MFSKYPEADGVICIIRLAALHSWLKPLVTGGHSNGVSFVPVAPPIRAWQSLNAANPWLAAAIFHWTRISPAVGPRVVLYIERFS